MSDDPLSHSTARLSISTIDVENDNPRLQVKELLNSTELTRRDSVVSITSMDEIDSLKTNERMKRRRSSIPIIKDNLSNNINNNNNNNGNIHRDKRNKLDIPSNGSSESNTNKKSKKKHRTPSLQFDIEESDKRLPFHCIRELVLKAFNSSSNKSKWFRFEHENFIPNVVFCLVPGLPADKFSIVDDSSKSQLISMESVESNEDLDFFNNNFKQFIQTSCPGGKDTLFPPIQAITNIPLTKREKSDLLNAPKNKSITIYDLLLTESQLIQNNYPMSLDDEDKVDKGWVETKSFEHEGSHIFALDCEFCQSNSGKVLTRISLINFQGDLVMDLLVKPDEEITDYLTKYSGITEELLKDVTTTLQDIQTKLLAIISDDDILIGHSLESDLNVMKIKHTKIVDTSVIYEHVRGPPSKPSLKWLSNKFLNRAIQTGELNGDGHSSIEDAQACLDLVKLKFTEGKYFGLNVGEMSLFKKISKEFKQDDFKSLFINYSDYKYQEAYNEPIENKVQVEYVNNDDEVVEKFVENFNEDKRFTILTLRELEFNNNDRFNCQIPEHYNGIRDSKSEEEMNELYKTLNQRLTTIYERLPQDSLMIIHSVIGDAKEMIRLQNIRKQFQKLEREGVDVTKLASEDSWDFDKLQELYEATTNAKKSVTFITLKE